MEQIYYRGLLLDRASELRKSPDWLNQQWHHPECQVLLLQNDKNLMFWNRELPQDPTAIYHSRAEFESLSGENETVVFLGLNGLVPLFAAEIGRYSEEYLSLEQEPHQFVDLREAGCLLNALDAATLAYGRGLLYWNRHSLFCSRCGSPTVKQQGGHVKRCGDEGCGHLIFPRTDPAVIMLIEDQSTPTQPRCLLGRNSRFPSRMMSTLAGFVDPSESLEETVAREAFEEAGVRVDKINYQASQPWPFPASIMLGFRAQAVTTDICIDGVEIEEADWFTVEQLENFGEWGDDSDNYCLPRHDSIARHLIESWMSDVRSKERGA
jgi:NAD+ diphosphatase